MKFNPEIHHRQSIRLRDYNYSRAGAYFVTVCVFERECLFGELVDGEMRLNEAGRMVRECWDGIPDHFPHVELDAFIIMPNHLHGIFVLNDDASIVGARHASPDFPVQMAATDRATHARATHARATHASPLRGPGPEPRSIGAMVGSFKSAVTKRINQSRNTPGAPVWQRNYYERVIRGERELDGIRRYIVDNPAKWAEDENHPSRV